jgi:5'(3')-deoxyribonucleotidase
VNKILAVDIDEVVIDVWPTWLNWCNTMFDKTIKAEDIGWEYDLTKIFGKSCMDFWATPNLYQRFKPREGCVETLSKLYSEGWEIGFVSYAKKGHFASKCDFINEWFPFRSFIHCTKEKGYTRCTHFLDDRHKYLDQQPEDVVVIKMKTRYTQDQELNRFFVRVDGWEEVYKYLKGE